MSCGECRGPSNEEGRRCAPFLVFRTDHHSYVYDGAINQIFRVTPDAARLADSFYRGEHVQEALVEELGAQAHGEAVRLLSSLRERTGVLTFRVPERVVADQVSAEDARDRLYSLVLNVTESCNLRCGYCVYGGAYPSKRAHGTSRMSWETAKAAIDYVADHSAKSTFAERLLGWYGGEPFLNFDVIKRSSAYFRERFKDYRIKFSITSNAVCWSEEMIDFLVANDVELTVSLDGEAEDHDAQRRNVGGGGTHAEVCENLVRLQRRSERYFRSKLNINAVISKDTDLARLNRYFRSFPARVSISTVEPRDLSEASLLPVRLTGWQEMRVLFQEGCQKRAFDSPQFKEMGYNFVYYLFIREMERIHRRQPASGFPAILPALGCCQPGMERIFVTCNGEIETCEKTDGSLGLRLGNLQQGAIDNERRTDIFDALNGMDFPDCRLCFNVRFCSICFAHALHNGELVPRKRRWNCDNLRRKSAEMLSFYCEVLENDPHAFDFIDEKLGT